jgi:hypothetical protein
VPGCCFLRSMFLASTVERTTPTRLGGRCAATALPPPVPLSTTTRRAPEPTPSPPQSRNRYRLEARIVRLREERRAMIEAAEVELVERDGRVSQLRRLPSAVTE